ncbi:MAG: alpha/beta fold hydrolase [Actinomycetota bacterium]
MTDGLLLLHAWPVDARMWEAEVTALEPTVQVVAPHHPGFGGRSVGAVLSMEAAANSALSAIDAAGVDRAVVVGCSLGGYVAFELWRRAPERVLGLGLVNTRAVADPPEAVQGRHELAGRLRSDGSTFLVEDPPPLLSEGAPREVAERVRGWIAEQPADSIAAAALGMAERPDSTPDLPGIVVPTLVLTSTEDRLIPSSVSLAMAELLPDAESVVLGGAGHLSNLEAPGPFLEALRGLLRRSGLIAGAD